jgi:hypothetical protein
MCARTVIAMIPVTHHRFRGEHTINTLLDVLQRRWLLRTLEYPFDEEASRCGSEFGN